MTERKGEGEAETTRRGVQIWLLPQTSTKETTTGWFEAVQIQARDETTEALNANQSEAATRQRREEPGRRRQIGGGEGRSKHEKNDLVAGGERGLIEEAEEPVDGEERRRRSEDDEERGRGSVRERREKIND